MVVGAWVEDGGRRKMKEENGRMELNPENRNAGEEIVKPPCQERIA